MTFRGDAQGFLVGELLDTNRSLLRTTQQDRAIWRGISADVAAIARALGAKASAPGRALDAGRRRAASASAIGAVTVKPAGRGSSAGARPTNGAATAPGATGRPRAAAQIGSDVRTRIVMPRSRDVRGRFLSAAYTRPATSDPTQLLQGHAPVVTPRRAEHRSANGRFAGGGPRDGSDSAVDADGVGGPAHAVARSVVAGLLDAAGGGASSVDPTLQAAAEIKDVVAPLGRGMFSAMGERRKESRRERWYGRILSALTRRRAADGATAAYGGDANNGGGLLGTMAGAMTGALGRLLPAIAAALLPVLAGLAAGAMGTWIGTKIYAWLDSSGILAKVFDAFDNVRSFVDDARKKATTWIRDATTGLRQGFTGDPALDASGRVIDDPRRVDAKAKTLPQRVGEAVGAGARVVADVMARPAQALSRVIGGAADTVAAGVRRVVAAGKGYTEVEEANGTLSRRTGARNWRNNNPGNLEFNEYTKSLGAVGSDGRFAVFPTLAAGRQAQGKMLFEGAKYRRLDLKAAIERYAPPKENDTARYQKSVLAAVGGANKAMSDYSPAERAAILDAMARVEGFKAGTVTPVTGPATAVATPRLSMSNPPKLSLPVMPKLPAVPQDAPPPAMPIADRRDSTVVVVQESVGQNVRDRTIAHAVTGGLGG
ncbi:hypothetical protein [Ideonella sp.]|uniref:hypothetical protein n=1 Tax=Ideonella sp. TaxID=1929293 RepID=UPI0035B3AC03